MLLYIGKKPKLHVYEVYIILIVIGMTGTKIYQNVIKSNLLKYLINLRIN